MALKEGDHKPIQKTHGGSDPGKCRWGQVAAAPNGVVRQGLREGAFSRGMKRAGRKSAGPGRRGEQPGR